MGRIFKRWRVPLVESDNQTMPDMQVKAFLYNSGHYHNPAMTNANNVKEDDLPKLSIVSKETKEAIRSLQDFDANYYHCCNRVHAKSMAPDGELGPATSRLMALDRCGMPDYDILGEAGSGYFPIPGCDPKDPERDKVASVRAYIDTGRAASTQKGYIDWCMLAAQHCSAEFGLRVRWIDNKNDAELAIAFKAIRGSTIGYFYLPQESTCNQRMDGYLDTGYNPSRRMFARLLIHEQFGHGIGHGHTSGGIMNPSILDTVNSDAGWPSWEDGSRRNEAAKRMTRWFGGEPVSLTPGDEPEPEPPISEQVMTIRGKFRYEISGGHQFG